MTVDSNTSPNTFTIVPEGPFSLEESATFGFGQRQSGEFDGTMRLAFCLDGHGYSRQVGVFLQQDSDSAVQAQVVGDADLATVRAQVARVLSLDHDARVFLAIGERDPVMARLLAVAPGLRPPFAVAPGLRPPLFYSPYEAAVWSVLSARRPGAQMMEVRRRLSEEHGQVFELAGERLAALPTPEQLLAVDALDGIPALKLDRMHRIAEAALEGLLDCDRLRAMDPDEAMLDLQRLPGIGPFYSALIVMRATGHADVLPQDEPKSLAMTGELYGLGHPATPEELHALAENWRPFRTWAVVLLRAAGPRLLGR